MRSNVPLVSCSLNIPVRTFLMTWGPVKLRRSYGLGITFTSVAWRKNCWWWLHCPRLTLSGHGKSLQLSPTASVWSFTAQDKSALTALRLTRTFMSSTTMVLKS